MQRAILILVFIVISGCALDSSKLDNMQRVVHEYCVSASQLPEDPNHIVASDANQITYADCMVDRGYIERL